MKYTALALTTSVLFGLPQLSFAENNWFGMKADGFKRFLFPSVLYMLCLKVKHNPLKLIQLLQIIRKQEMVLFKLIMVLNNLDPNVSKQALADTLNLGFFFW